MQLQGEDLRCQCKYLTGIQVSGVPHGTGVVAIVPLFDNRVQKVCEYLKQKQAIKSSQTSHVQRLQAINQTSLLTPFDFIFI